VQKRKSAGRDSSAFSLVAISITLQTVGGYLLVFAGPWLEAQSVGRKMRSVRADDPQIAPLIRR
jgi:hypothetical protein